MELKRSALYEKVKRFEVVKPQPDEGMEACLRIFFYTCYAVDVHSLQWILTELYYQKLPSGPI